MKRIFLLLFVFLSLAACAQTIPSYKNVKLTQLPLGTKNDSIVLTNGSTKLLKYIPVSQIKVPTNLDYTATPTGGTVFSSTGNDAVIPLATTTNAGLFSPTDKTTIDGVQSALALKANVADSELKANKQNDLTIDGTGTKYPTVDAVNSAIHWTKTVNDISNNNTGKVKIGNPTSDVIGHPSDSFNADLSIKGSSVRIENTTGESLIVNTTAYAGESHFYDANVLAIQNKSTYLGALSQVPSAIRFLSNTDGEMGAIGYQNGAVGTPFANSMFIAASMPYYPSNPLVAPTRLALIQEGDYLGALTKIERLEFNSDWSTKFKTPNGTPRITIPVEGRVLINNATDNLTDDLQVNGSVKATTLKGNSLTSNLVLKATTNGQITNSTITDNGTFVGIGNNSSSPAENLEIRTTTNSNFAMTRNAFSNSARFYFRTGSTYNWGIGMLGSRNDLTIFNHVTGLESFAINATTNNVLIGTTTDISSSKFTISSTTQGFLLPRMTTAQINAIASPVEGLTVFNTDLDTLCFYTTSWQKVTSTTM